MLQALEGAEREHIVSVGPHARRLVGFARVHTWKGQASYQEASNLAFNRPSSIHSSTSSAFSSNQSSSPSRVNGKEVPLKDRCNFGRFDG